MNATISPIDDNSCLENPRLNPIKNPNPKNINIIKSIIIISPTYIISYLVLFML